MHHAEGVEINVRRPLCAVNGVAKHQKKAGSAGFSSNHLAHPQSRCAKAAPYGSLANSNAVRSLAAVMSASTRVASLSTISHSKRHVQL